MRAWTHAPTHMHARATGKLALVGRELITWTPAEGGEAVSERWVQLSEWDEHSLRHNLQRSLRGRPGGDDAGQVAEWTAGARPEPAWAIERAGDASGLPWMLTDGAAIGLGTLLEEVRPMGPIVLPHAPLPV